MFFKALKCISWVKINNNNNNDDDVLFDKHLIDKGNKNIVENFNESVKLKEN